MSSEDYLIRYFRQLGSVIAAIFDYRKRKMYSEAIEEIDTTLQTWFNIDPSGFESTSDEFVLQLLKNPSTGLETEKSIAELFYQKAQTYQMMKKTREAAETAKIALAIYKEIDAHSGEYSIENQSRIAELDQIVTRI